MSCNPTQVDLMTHLFTHFLLDVTHGVNAQKQRDRGGMGRRIQKKSDAVGVCVN